jgi:hypothetical protein
MHATALNALAEWGRVHEVRRAQPKLSGPLIFDSVLAAGVTRHRRLGDYF